MKARRDVAILGIIHRTILGLGPGHFRRFFRLAPAPQNPAGRVALHAHSYQLQSYRTGKYLDVAAHSLLGAVDVYNALPEYVVAAESVKDFQNRLQQMLKIGAREHHMDWDTMLSNRHLMFRHPLLKFSGFTGLQSHGTPASVQEKRNENASAACVKGWLNMRD